MIYDVAVVGGGPAGLAVALEVAQRGCSVVVFERRGFPVDKACGEGLMPSGLARLERLGVLPYLDLDDTSPFESITYVQEDGGSVCGRLPAPGGLGVRRLALMSAMTKRAREIGVTLHENTTVRTHRFENDGVTLETDIGQTRARLLVAADGLHSPLRRAEGLHRVTHGPKRFGMRRHVVMKPWAPTVEVHFAPGVEAYLTPAGVNRVGLAFLWADGQLETPVSFDTLLAKFPAIAERLEGATWDTDARGAGPLRQGVSHTIKDKFVLVGDAAGYVDAITGEGLSLAFEGAAALARVLPEVLKHHGSVASLAPYENEMHKVFRRYATLASLLVWTARYPTIRRTVLNRLIAAPRLFEWVLARVTA